MKFYLATHRSQEAERAAGLGFVQGLVVPRAEVVATGRDYPALVAELSEFSFNTVCAQSDELDASSLSDEARNLAGGLGERFVLLAPVTLESIKATARLSGKIAMALELVASPVQAMAAARCGARAVCVPSRRFMRAGLDACRAADDMRSAFARYGLATEVWVDDPGDVAELERLVKIGVDAVLCRWDLLRTVAYHPFTDRGVERMLAE